MGLAERNGVSPLEMQPLYQAVEPGVLDTLFRNGRSGRVTFGYAGYEVTVHGNGHIAIHETESSTGEGQRRASERSIIASKRVTRPSEREIRFPSDHSERRNAGRLWEGARHTRDSPRGSCGPFS